MNKKMPLILGGTGKTGSRILKRLRDRGIAAQTGSRTATPPFDWEDRTTWSLCLQNANKVYIAFQPDLAVPGAVETIQAFANTAATLGVEHLVLLSGRGEPEAQQCEDAVKASGVAWTILRASWFCQNFSEGYLADSIREGFLALPAGAVGEPFVDADDIADVAMAALTEKGHLGKLYELTGPRLISFAQAVDEIAQATGIPIRYEQVSQQDFATALAEQQVPREYISLLSYLFNEVLDGRNASLAHGVEQALNRKPTDFRVYIEKVMKNHPWHDRVNEV
ncbi:NmrA family transcriptional regulator [Chryseolinea lacunae]|uniref:NmrA family transcriptional regulator n=1 Tax=Chryseolinea lacunae TaxID=2801331 RepID=A0ABS1KMB2_9BACT|nr:NmrA family transcriptional regulator [Chryseolinea lacunae]MBL0740397.1 NmrA family transcriptional regulator [Chryseolinea lacunae]